MKFSYKRNNQLHKLSIAALLISAFAITSCATVTNYDAAEDIRQLAIGLRDNNYSQIESHIDKTALKRQVTTIAQKIIKDEINSQFGSGTLGLLSLNLTDALNPLIDTASDMALRPEVLAYFAKQAGIDKNTQIPSRFKASLALKNIDSNKVCVPDEKTHNCLLYFGKYDDSWKLNHVDEAALSKNVTQIVEKKLKDKFKL